MGYYNLTFVPEFQQFDVRFEFSMYPFLKEAFFLLEYHHALRWLFPAFSIYEAYILLRMFTSGILRFDQYLLCSFSNYCVFWNISNIFVANTVICSSLEFSMPGGYILFSFHEFSVLKEYSCHPLGLDYCECHKELIHHGYNDSIVHWGSLLTLYTTTHDSELNDILFCLTRTTNTRSRPNSMNMVFYIQWRTALLNVPSGSLKLITVETLKNAHGGVLLFLWRTNVI